MSELQIQDQVITYKLPELVELLNENIIWIEILENDNTRLNTRYPYTRSNIKDLNFKYTDNELQFDTDETRCYNLATNEYVTIKFDQTGQYMYHDHLSAGLVEFKLHEEQINEAIKTLPNVDKNKIRITRYRPKLNVNTNAVWQGFCFVEFIFDDLKEIYTGDVSEERFADIKTWYVDKIRQQRVEAFEELDMLEEETRAAGGTQEDIEDIDTIKQMFRDIPQDLDLSTFKTVEQLFNFWPSLLLPRKLAKLDPYIKNLVIDRTITEKEELSNLLKDFTIESIDELKTLLNELENIPAEESDNDKEWAVNMLRKKVLELEE